MRLRIAATFGLVFSVVVSHGWAGERVPAPSKSFGRWLYLVADEDCTAMDKLVRFTAERLSGPGHCYDETVGHFKNDASVALDCFYAFYRNGNRVDGGVTMVGPGDTAGGEFGGVWSCGVEATMKFACFRHVSGFSSCGAHVSW